MDGYRPLQKIDYVNNHKRCDDDLRLAERLSTASKYVVGIAVCWIVIIALCASAGYFD